MLITEMIAQLETLKEKHGDLEVFAEIEESKNDIAYAFIDKIRLGKNFMQTRNVIYLTHEYKDR